MPSQSAKSRGHMPALDMGNVRANDAQRPWRQKAKQPRHACAQVLPPLGKPRNRSGPATADHALVVWGGGDKGLPALILHTPQQIQGLPMEPARGTRHADLAPQARLDPPSPWLFHHHHQPPPPRLTAQNNSPTRGDRWLATALFAQRERARRFGAWSDPQDQIPPLGNAL